MQIMHIRECRNCFDQFTTYEQNMLYCDLCSYMESTIEYKERMEALTERRRELLNI